VVPAELELMRHEDTHNLRHLLTVIREVTYRLDGLEQHSHPVTMHSPITGLHHSPVAWIQEHMLYKCLMPIWGVEAWKVAYHTHRTTTRGGDFPEGEDPVRFHVIHRLAAGLAGQFSAELPVPTVKPAILAVRGGRNDTASPRQCYWAPTNEDAG
jgi:hypothetical protein